MRTEPKLIAACLLVSGIALTAIIGSTKRVVASPAARPALFAGKVIAISSRSSDTGAVLEKVSVMTLSDKAFLVGNGVATNHPDDWVQGRRVWVPVDDVSQLAEFDSVEQFTKSGGQKRER